MCIDAVTREVRLFSKFDEETRRIASAFYKLGLRKGDMVIFMPTEVIKLHIFLAGVWRANGVCRASYPEDDAATLRQRLVEGECKFILCDHNGIATCREAVIGIAWSVEIIVMEKHNELKSLQQFLEEDDGEACPAIDVGKEDPALILCTSGTTGPSKGALHTHKGLMQQMYLLSLFPFMESKPNLIFSKGTHISGSTFPFSLLVSGKTAIITGKITNEITLKTVHELKPGFAFAFPTFLLVLVSPEAQNYDTTSLKILWSGGTTITPATIDALFQLSNVKDFINAYGLTENMTTTTSAILSSASESERSSDPKSIRDLPAFATGTTYPDTRIQVRDIDTMEVLGPHKKGEICVKGPAVFKEYYKNPEATKAAFIDGFFRTGDIGYYDEHGYIYISDRLKEVFKYFNNHISPSELEGVIGRHPNVSEVCVVGIPDPNGGGDIPRAFVTVNGNPSPELAEEIKKLANDSLPNYKHLRGGVYIIPEMPQGKTGKVTRRLVAELKP
ncbi:Luciferin 4-monooxygenase [Orchesella cincta]|uniref:Luciferin 4-monooxygenase n=1 Tax=Orchesella cincta TaxID=48709 RepID=A0A1D2MC83_ORCCI|nr:Luciferin 4-monooxygenase [Orchesella cincta]